MFYTEQVRPQYRPILYFKGCPRSSFLRADPVLPANFVVASAMQDVPTEGDAQNDSPLPAPPDFKLGAYIDATGLTEPSMSWSWIGVVPDAIPHSTADESLYMQALFQEGGNIQFIAQRPQASLLKSLLHNGGKQAFKSADAFKKYYGAAGEKMHWHHIVEQHVKNRMQFGVEKIHNINNIVKIPAKIHEQISAFYSRGFAGSGMTFRQAVSKLPMDAQYKIGVQVMRKFGVGM